jgi:D-alanyl-lipoteichoic acid acyltransferase DltB (MBOAT superfamily)
MVFSSLEFIFIFLPIAYGVLTILLRCKRARTAMVWLLLASFFFYGYWNPKYLVLIGGSIIVNFGVGRVIDPDRPYGKQARRALLVLGLAFNLGLLVYFKYLNLLVDTANAFASTDFHLEKIILPIGISFFTFQQISYLVDRYQGLVVNKSLLNYALFVVYFPQLIAGPIVHHREMLDQFDEGRGLKVTFENMSYGLTYFLIGVAKKTLLADPLAIHANAVFGAADAGVDLTAHDAWIGALAYTGQIYFDFAGYSAMAIGLGMMVGVKLPLNFNSPYKALSIQDFWRRWHITLSRFLRDYLYVPLGGNRQGEARRLVNLMLTMLIGGLWHGANWTFLVWGGLHGLYLVVNRAFDIAAKRVASSLLDSMLAKILAWALTFLAVVVAWVFFRATTFGSAFEVMRSMAAIGNGADAADRIALTPGDWTLFAISAYFAFIAPNAAQFMNYQPTNTTISAVRATPVWRPSLAFAAIVGVIGFLAILATQKNNEFIYFQF